MHHRKYYTCHAPADAEVEPGDVFTVERDDENGGCCLLTYTGDKKTDNHPDDEDVVKSVILPEAVKGLPVIGVDSECLSTGFTDVYYPESLKYFRWGDEKKPVITGQYVIAEGTETIDYKAFPNCIELKSVMIPESVRKIEWSAFYDCASMEKILVDENNAVYASIDGLLCNRKKTKLIRCPEGITGEITIPPGIMKVGVGAFFHCRLLTKINLPDGVNMIGRKAFEECCNLTSINIPDSVVKIVRDAFEHCKSLLEITIPDGLKKIPAYAFSKCISLESVKFSSNVTTIGYGAFYGCKSLAGINIPENTVKIKNLAFAQCTALNNVGIPDSVTELGANAFFACEKLPDTVKIKIGEMRRKSYEQYSVSVKGQPDVLSFEKINIQPGLNSKEYIYTKTALFAKTIINGRPYIDIMEPYLYEAASTYYGYNRSGFIYDYADSIYKELTGGCKNGERDVCLIDITYAYDQRQPLCVIVTETEREIIWSAYCHYYDLWPFGELPVFRFEKAQYGAAMEQLKAIVDEQSKMPTKESLGEAVYTGGLWKEKRSGYGTLRWDDGSTFEGVWEKGKPQGLFIHTDENGGTRREVWSNGVLVELP